jgi:hypothetical protein
MGIKKIHALFWQQSGRSWLSFDAGFEDTSRSVEGSSQARTKGCLLCFFLGFILPQLKVATLLESSDLLFLP